MPAALCQFFPAMRIHPFPVKTLLALGILTSLAPAVRAAGPGTLRENIEWCDCWFPGSEKSDLPHVVLIGDSITRGYYPIVAKCLTGKAYVARMASSQFLSDPLLLGQLRLFLSQMKVDVIHFNNGMHGWNYTEEQYRAAFPAFLAAIRESAPHAKLIWAATTPTSLPGHPDQDGPLTARVKVRNAIAREFIATAAIPEDDLFALCEAHPEYHDDGGIHFKPEAIALQGQQVAAAIEKLLPAAK